jgi:Na+-transporting NADH:ubiquinone oxidoreductase subunit NqrC
MLNSLNHLVIPEVKVMAAIAPVNGQGLWSTIWKECSFLIIINGM